MQLFNAKMFDSLSFRFVVVAVSIVCRRVSSPFLPQCTVTQMIHSNLIPSIIIFSSSFVIQRFILWLHHTLLCCLHYIHLFIHVHVFIHTSLRAHTRTRKHTLLYRFNPRMCVWSQVKIHQWLVNVTYSCCFCCWVKSALFLLSLWLLIQNTFFAYFFVMSLSLSSLRTHVRNHFG